MKDPAVNHAYEITPDDKLREFRVLTIPLIGREWAAIRVPYPMTDGQWVRMLALLDLMKPGIVSDERVVDRAEVPGGISQ